MMKSTSFQCFLLCLTLLVSACATSKKTKLSAEQKTEIMSQPKPKSTTPMQVVTEPTPEPEKETAEESANKPPKGKKKGPFVLLETEYGNMKIHLFDETPQHRDNFLKLVKEGFYNDLLFHRVISGFMIQGGDPNSKGAAAGVPLGMGGPGYTIPAEFHDDFTHLKGMLSAARQSDQVNPQKASSGSQFYIVQGKPVPESMLQMIESRKGFKYTDEQRQQYLTLGGTPHLDRDYTVFGQVIEGLEVIDKIAAVQTNRGNRPMVDVKMKMKIVK